MRRGKCQWPPYIKPFLFLRYASSSSVVYFIHSSTSLDVTTCRYKWWKWAFSKGCLAFGYRVRSSAKWEGLSIEPLLPHMEMSQFGHLAKMPPVWGVLGMSLQMKTEDTLERLYLSLAWDCLCVPLYKLEEAVGEREAWGSLHRLLPLIRSPR